MTNPTTVTQILVDRIAELENNQAAMVAKEVASAQAANFRSAGNTSAMQLTTLFHMFEEKVQEAYDVIGDERIFDIFDITASTLMAVPEISANNQLLAMEKHKRVENDD